MRNALKLFVIVAGLIVPGLVGSGAYAQSEADPQPGTNAPANSPGNQRAAGNEPPGAMHRDDRTPNQAECQALVQNTGGAPPDGSIGQSASAEAHANDRMRVQQCQLMMHSVGN